MLNKRRLNKKNFLLGLLIPVFIVLAIIFIYVYILNYDRYEIYWHDTLSSEQKKEIKKYNPDMSIHLNPELMGNLLDNYGREFVPPKIDTSDWQLYEDKKTGLSFKYPKDWVMGPGWKLKGPNSAYFIFLTTPLYPTFVNALLPGILRKKDVVVDYIVVDSIKSAYEQHESDVFHFVYIPKKHRIFSISTTRENKDVFYGILQTLRLDEKFDEVVTNF